MKIRGVFVAERSIKITLRKRLPGGEHVLQLQGVDAVEDEGQRGAQVLLAFVAVTTAATAAAAVTTTGRG